jgi:hypothetical protein
MAADERVHKKTHFGPIPEAQASQPQQEVPALSKPSPIGASGGLAEAVARVNGQEQPQTLTIPDQKELAHRRDIYSIHGEQVSTLALRTGQDLVMHQAFCQPRQGITAVTRSRPISSTLIAQAWKLAAQQCHPPLRHCQLGCRVASSLQEPVFRLSHELASVLTVRCPSCTAAVSLSCSAPT